MKLGKEKQINRERDTEGNQLPDLSSFIPLPTPSSHPLPSSYHPSNSLPPPHPSLTPAHIRPTIISIRRIIHHHCCAMIFSSDAGN